MASLNKVFLIGNLTRDVQLRYTRSGTPIAQFRLAINRRFRDQEGNQKEETVFVDVETWGRQAETVSEYLAKGWTAFVDGRLRLDEWTSRDGTRRSKLVVVAERVQSLGPAKRVDTPASRVKAEEAAAQQEPPRETPQEETPPADFPPPEEDLPEEEPPF